MVIWTRFLKYENLILLSAIFIISSQSDTCCLWYEMIILSRMRGEEYFQDSPLLLHLLRISLDFLSHLFLVVLSVLTPCCLPQTKSQTWIVQSNSQSLKTVPISNECDVCSDKDQIISRLLCLKKKINIHEKVVLQLYSFILVQSSVCPCLYLYIYILDFRLSHQHACELFLLSVFKN